MFYGPSAPTPHTPNVAQPDTVRVVVVKGTNAVKWYNAYQVLTGRPAADHLGLWRPGVL